jgi:hypothetical protein
MFAISSVVSLKNAAVVAQPITPTNYPFHASSMRAFKNSKKYLSTRNERDVGATSRFPVIIRRSSEACMIWDEQDLKQD